MPCTQGDHFFTCGAKKMIKKKLEGDAWVAILHPQLNADKDNDGMDKIDYYFFYGCMARSPPLWGCLPRDILFDCALGGSQKNVIFFQLAGYSQRGKKPQPSLSAYMAYIVWRGSFFSVFIGSSAGVNCWFFFWCMLLTVLLLYYILFIRNTFSR